MSEQQSDPVDGVPREQFQPDGGEPNLSSDQPQMDVTRRLYVIESAGVHLALDDVFSCGEVLSEPSIYPLPGCDSCLLGVCYRRGDIVPIYDLELLLGVDESESDRAQHWPELNGHHNVHYLPVNRKMHKTYVVVMGVNDEARTASLDESGAGNGSFSGSIGFALSAPPKSLTITEDDSRNAQSADHCLKGIMPKFVRTTTRYAKVDRPIIHLDWFGYCVAQVKALADS